MAPLDEPVIHVDEPQSAAAAGVVQALQPQAPVARPTLQQQQQQSFQSGFETAMNGGRFDFDDGGTYCGGWEDGKAHGHGVCTGPKGQGEYAGAWHYGFEVSGVYVWPSGNTYAGQWQNGKRHGLGVETRGRWIYRGEWTQGYKGRYGTRQSTNSNAAYAGTWSSGLQDGYGTETYADTGTYQGQWLRGMRHGYGIRKSAAYGVAAKFRSRSHAHASLTSLRSNEQHENDIAHASHDGKVGQESRGGFVLRARSDAPHRRRRSLSERTLHMKQTILTGLRIKKQKSTSDIHARVMATETPRSVRSSGSTMSCTSDESGYDGRHDEILPPDETIEATVTESYMGEWKNDKRSGFGISERSDGLKYEGEWFNNKKFGYGVTTLRDGVKEEGKYKNNVLVTSQRKKHLLFVRSSKLRERIEAAIQAANRAAQIAMQKADIAVSRMSTAKDRTEQADFHCQQASADSDLARIHAKQFDPNFQQPGVETMKRQRYEMGNHIGFSALQHQAMSLDGGHPLGAQPTQIASTSQPVMNMRQESMPMNQEHPYDLDSGPIGEIGFTQQNMVPGSSQQTQHSQMQQGSATLPYDLQQGPPDFQPPEMGDAVITVPTPMIMSSTEGPSTSYAGGQTPTAPQAPLPSAPAAQLPSAPPTVPQVRATIRQRGGYNQPGDNASLEGDPSLMQFNDHHEQYRRDAQPGQTNQPLTAKSTFQDNIPGFGPPIQRRTTLSSNRDNVVTGHVPPSTADDLAAVNKPSTSKPVAHAMGDLPVGPAAQGPEKGSLPTIPQLDKSPLLLKREDVARMSSQRRQEMLRIEEEEELLRGNPLRYMFHPAVRAWVIRWKLPLLVVLVNVCLSIVFYQLLTFADDDDDVD